MQENETHADVPCPSRRRLLESAARGGGLAALAGLFGSDVLGIGTARAQDPAKDGGYVAAYVFKRAPGMSLEAFLDHYENVHGPLMVELMKDKGLVSYVHYPVRPVGTGDDYVPAEGPAFDAVSIYAFENGEGAHAAWNIPEVAEDSKRFIDFSTMVMLPLTARRVYP